MQISRCNTFSKLIKALKLSVKLGLNRFLVPATFSDGLGNNPGRTNKTTSAALPEVKLCY